MTIHHNCKESKLCFLLNLCPDWAWLSPAFPGKITVSDVDGWVELKGRLLIFEWKSPGVELPKGQEILAVNATNINKLTFFVINGDPKTSTPEYLKIYIDGEIRWEGKCDKDYLFKCCQLWVKRVQEGCF